MANLTVWLKSPFTDLTGNIISHQWFSGCAEMEMKAMDCMEAYGLDRGIEKCDAIIQDFKECSLQTKQFRRIYAMRLERHRQHFAGERKKEEKYVEGPPADSY